MKSGFTHLQWIPRVQGAWRKHWIDEIWRRWAWLSVRRWRQTGPSLVPGVPTSQWSYRWTQSDTAPTTKQTYTLYLTLSDKKDNINIFRYWYNTKRFLMDVNLLNRKLTLIRKIRSSSFKSNSSVSIVKLVFPMSI